MFSELNFWSYTLLLVLGKNYSTKKLEQVRNYLKYSSGFEQVFEDL